MKFIIFISLILQVVNVHALVINEIMSNPVGDDNGREWIELYNDTDESLDLSSLTISVKSGPFNPVTPVSGGMTIPAFGYAIIGSTVSNATKFALDYPLYTGPLFRSSASLVNTGVTSLEIKLNGISQSTIASYTAAKEGSTYSLIQGSYGTGLPTPGEENKSSASLVEDTTLSVPQAGTQSTIPQMAPPNADIVVYLPSEKIVVAGAPSLFQVSAMTRAGKGLDAMRYQWSFGDGGQSTGSSTIYRYYYPGRYVAIVEGTNGQVSGTARMNVRVVSPDISLSSISSGRYGQYVTVTNPNVYDLDLSDWKLSIDGSLFSFPKNSILPPGQTKFAGVSMGFSSTTVSSSTMVKLLFPNMDEVIRVEQEATPVKQNLIKNVALKNQIQNYVPKVKIQTTVSTTTLSKISTSTPGSKSNKKDVRLATYLMSFFGK